MSGRRSKPAQPNSGETALASINIEASDSFTAQRGKRAELLRSGNLLTMIKQPYQYVPTSDSVANQHFSTLEHMLALSH